MVSWNYFETLRHEAACLATSCGDRLVEVSCFVLTLSLAWSSRGEIFALRLSTYVRPFTFEHFKKACPHDADHPAVDLSSSAD